jgi:uncharacterized membrane protein YciS (DUF1049 family)
MIIMKGEFNMIGIYLIGFCSGLLVYSLGLIIYYTVQLHKINKRIKKNEAKIRNMQLLKEDLRRIEENMEDKTA